MQNQQLQGIELTKEINILYELGLEEWEIEYIIYLRTKQEAGKKFNNKGETVPKFKPYKKQLKVG